MMTGVWPSASASREVAVLKVVGVETGAKAEATENKAEMQRSFMMKKRERQRERKMELICESVNRKRKNLKKNATSVCLPFFIAGTKHVLGSLAAIREKNDVLRAKNIRMSYVVCI